MDRKIAGKASRPRRSSAERREAIIDAAAAEFAVGGLHGTSTHAIARRAGISQPYVFQLFGSKKDLFLAACARSFGRVRAAFSAAVAERPGEPLDAMGAAYLGLLRDREDLLTQLQAYAASSDPEVRRAVRGQFAELARLVQGLSGARPEAVRRFLAHGVFLGVCAALDLPAEPDAGYSPRIPDATRDVGSEGTR